MNNIKVNAEVVKVRDLAVVCRVKGESEFATLPLGLLEKAFSESGARLGEGAKFSIDVKPCEESDEDPLDKRSPVVDLTQATIVRETGFQLMCSPTGSGNGSHG